MKGRESTTGLYCKEHGCKTKGCHMKRIGREYCPYHECVVDRCEAEAKTNRHCEDHQRPEGGYERRRQTLRGTIFATREDGKFNYEIGPKVFC